MKSVYLSAIVFAALTAAAPVAARAETIRVTVKGMVCSFCAQGIRKTFGKMEEVEKIEVDMDAKIVTIRSRKDARLEDSVITEKIKDAGYDVHSIVRSGDE